LQQWCGVYGSAFGIHWTCSELLSNAMKDVKLTQNFGIGSLTLLIQPTAIYKKISINEIFENVWEILKWHCSSVQFNYVRYKDVLG